MVGDSQSQEEMFAEYMDTAKILKIKKTNFLTNLTNLYFKNNKTLFLKPFSYFIHYARTKGKTKLF